MKNFFQLLSDGQTFLLGPILFIRWQTECRQILLKFFEQPMLLLCIQSMRLMIVDILNVYPASESYHLRVWSLSVRRPNDWVASESSVWSFESLFMHLNAFNLNCFDCIAVFSRSAWKDISKNHHFGLLSSKHRIDQPKFSTCF